MWRFGSWLLSFNYFRDPYSWHFSLKERMKLEYHSKTALSSGGWTILIEKSEQNGTHILVEGQWVFNNLHFSWVVSCKPSVAPKDPKNATLTSIWACCNLLTRKSYISTASNPGSRASFFLSAFVFNTPRVQYTSDFLLQKSWNRLNQKVDPEICLDPNVFQ